MNQRIKIGVLSTANIAKKAIIPAINILSEEFELVGIASRNLEKAENFANEFKTIAYGSYEELIDSNTCDAVYIPLPNSMHYEWIKKCLDLNIHVLVEKSLTCSYTETKELVDLAKAKDLVLMENFQFRFHPQLAFIKSKIADGSIGEIRSVRSSFGFPPFADSNNIRYQKELGGGALFDSGAYPIKIAQEFLGRDVNVTSAKWHFDNETEVDLWGGGFIEQNNGDLFAEFSFGFDHHYQCNIEIWGSKGKISTNRIFTAPPGYSAQISIETGEGKEIIEIEEANHYVLMLEHFSNLIKGTKDKSEENDQNLKQSQLIEQFRTIANGK